MLTTTYELDIVPGGVPQVIPVSQYDTNSRILTFSLVNSAGTLSLPSGVSAAVRGTKPDGNGFDNTCTISGTTVTVTVTEQMAAVAGRVFCEVYLYSGTYGQSGYKQIATANFILHVERAALDKDTLISGSDIRQLVDVVDHTSELLQAAATVTTLHNQTYGYRTDAQTAAQSAATSATNASDSATAAAASASAASTDATAASGSATSAAASATLAESWAVGGTDTRTGEDTDNSKYYAEQSAAKAAESANSANSALDALHRATITGNPITITSRLNNLPLRSLNVGIDYVQAGSGDPSPSNVRGISGLTSVKITRSGRNFLPVFTAQTISGVTMTVADDGTLTFNGTATADAWFDAAMDYYIPSDVRYTLCAFNPEAATNTRLNLFVTAMRDDTGLGANTQVYPDRGANQYMVSGVLTTGIRLTKLRVRIPSGYVCDNYVMRPMAVIGTTPPAEYEKGGVTAVSVELPSAAGTVYGGTLDVTRGILTVTRATETFSWGGYDGTSTSGDYKRRRFNFAAMADHSDTSAFVCSIAPYSASTTYSLLHFNCTRLTSSSYCYLYLPGDTDDSTTFQVSYPIATPIEYAVAAREIGLPEGYSLIGTNAANLTAEVYVNQIEYMTGYADDAIADMREDIIAAAYDATATYAAGEYCTHDGTLYRCDTAIAAAEAWTAAHWTAVTVGGELTEITDDLTDFRADWESVNGSTYETVGAGNPISYEDCVRGAGIQNVTLSIEPTQDGSGTPGPDNVRAISGTSGSVSLTRTGANILPKFSGGTSNGVTMAVADDGTVTLTGTASDLTYFDAAMDFTIPAGQTWALNAFNPEAGSDSSLTLFVNNDHSSVGINNAQVNLSAANAAMKGGGKTVAHKLILLRLRVPSGYDFGEGFTFRPMASLGSAIPEAYVAPDTQTVSVTIPATPGTVYGGTYNLTTGVLTVDRVMDTLTWGSYVASSSYGNYYRRTFNLTSIFDDSDRSKQLCNVAPYYYGTTTRMTHFMCYKYSSSRSRVYIFLPKSTPSDTSIQVVYPLATPLTYSIGTTAAMTCADDVTILDTSAAGVTVDFPTSKLRRYIHEQDAIPVGTEGIEDGAVTPDKTTFFETSSFNLINPANIDTGLYYSGSGKLTAAQDSTAFAFAGLIPVTEGQTYTLSGSAARYNVGGYFGVNASAEAGQESLAAITFVNPVTGDGKCFTVPIEQGIAFVGFNLGKNTETQEIDGEYQLEIGEMATEIVPYNEVTTIRSEYLPGSGSGGGATELTGLDTLPRPSYAHLQSRISSFRQHWLAKDKDLVVCGTGTSLTARSSEMCTLRADATSRPPLLHSNNFASRIWDRLCWDGQQYRRFDYEGYFTETGSWATATNGISDWDDYTYRYGITRYASGAASVAFEVPVDALQFNFIYRTDSQGATATVRVSQGNGKMQVYNGSAWVEANGYSFSMLETPVTLTDITIYNPNTSGNTQSIARTSYQVGGNSTYQRRLKMRCKGGSMDSRATAKTVTISAASGRLMYWGVEWSPREYMITYVNAARGSHNMTAYEQDNANDSLALSHYQDNEIWSFKPDLIFSEIPIHNSGGGGSSGTRFYYLTEYWGQAVYDFFLNLDNPVSLAARAAANGVSGVEWVLFNGSLTKNFGCFDDDGGLKLLTDNSGAVYTCMDAQGLCYKWLVDNRQDVIAVNACKYWVDAARAMFDGDLNVATAASGAGGSSFSNEGSHWNDMGGAVMARCVGGVFEFYS